MLEPSSRLNHPFVYFIEKTKLISGFSLIVLGLINEIMKAKKILLVVYLTILAITLFAG